MKRMDTIKLGKGFGYRFHRGTYRLRAYDPTQCPPDKTISLNTDHPGLAARRAQDYYQRFVAGLWSPWSGSRLNCSIGEAIAEYVGAKRAGVTEKSIRDICQTVRRATSNLGADAGLTQVSPKHLSRFLQTPNLAQATRASYYRKLSAFFNWTVKSGLLERSPLAQIPTPARPVLLPNGLKSDELSRLLAVANRASEVDQRFVNPYWAPNAFELLAWTGLRPSELSRLKWEDLRQDVILVRGRTKTHRERAVTRLPQASAVIERLPRCSENVVPGARGGRLYVPGLSLRFRHLRVLAGLPSRYTLYSLRHTFAAEYRRRGGSLAGLQHELGHRSITTTEKYGHLGPNERRDYTLGVFANDVHGLPSIA